MKLTHYPIHPALKAHVAKFWVFQSDHPIPESDSRIIVPNGLVKMVVPFKNGLKATLDERRLLTKTDCITLIGVADIPSVVVDEHSGPCGSIGVEFSPLGAYRFFNISFEHVKNEVLPMAEVIGKKARELQEQLANTEGIQEKLKLVQQFLLREFTLTRTDEIFEFCVSKIFESNGKINISQLEKISGYSARWLNMKFLSRIGISPKNLCSIVRFQEVHRVWALSGFKSFEGLDLYAYYHDQAHFIKDFKRFTGFAPNRFQSQDNDFGRIFYKG